MSNLFYIKISVILTILFFMGGIGLFALSAKEKRTRQLKIKYWVYGAIVLTHIICISYFLTGFRVLTLGVLLAGWFELIKLLQDLNKKNKLSIIFISLVLYSVICFGYYKFTFLNRDLILFVYMSVVSFDGFSQVTGVLFGKKQLVKQISPGKTMEGLFGGILGSFLIYFIFRFEASVQINNLFIKWILIILFAFTGDLLASLLKRIAGIKDFSHLIPGHGGVLDRFDSLIIAGSAMVVFDLFF